MNLEYLISLIKDNGGRMTKKRETILKQLVEYDKKLLTVDELLTLCQNENSDINITTIYRNLELLETLNLIHKVNLDRTTCGYKLNTAESHHHHLTCKDCGKVIDINYCPISPELLEMANQSKFTITEHNLELFGTCDDCD